jgi:hypothetical protein
MKNKPFYLSDEHTRSFGGKTEGFESREEAIREKKHLKAYLKGKKFFYYGFESVPYHQALGLKVEMEASDNPDVELIRVPKRYEVKEIWTPKNK